MLGAFFWLHWLTQLPGGILARRYGTKLVFGLSNALPGLLGLLIPAASYWDYRALLTIRFTQGIIAVRVSVRACARACAGLESPRCDLRAESVNV